MSAADRPMWTCPSCGHRVVSANIWHWCTQIRLDDAFARSTDGVDAIDDVSALLCESHRDLGQQESLGRRRAGAAAR